MFTSIDDLSFEIEGDTIDLEQSTGCGEVDRIRLHRIQLKHLAELAGIVQATSPSAEVLTRRMRALRGRIEHLADWLANHSDHKHADLTYELNYATATADVAEAYCEGLDGTDELPETVESAGPAQPALI